MFSKAKNVLAVALVSLFGTQLALASGATPIDVTAATDQLGTIDTTILAVGGALLVAAAVAVAVKWAKASIFG